MGMYQKEGILGNFSATLLHPFRNNERIVINIPDQSTTDTIQGEVVAFPKRSKKNNKHYHKTYKIANR